MITIKLLHIICISTRLFYVKHKHSFTLNHSMPEHNISAFNSLSFLSDLNRLFINRFVFKVFAMWQTLAFCMEKTKVPLHYGSYKNHILEAN